MTGYDFTVEKTDLEATHLRSVAVPAATDGQIVLSVDRFAISTNNITYGVAGEAMGYWNFFPATEDGEGHLPVWGIGTVVDSAVSGIDVGGRHYGYFPMASHHAFLAEPCEAGFIERVNHRQQLPPLYNRYTEVTEAAGFGEGDDTRQSLYRILFETGFVLDDHLAEHDFFGAEQIVLSSASSKTSISTAFALERREINVVGLTSEKNRSFVEGLDLYDDVVTYDEIADQDADMPTAYADMSGNGSVLAAVHGHFGDRLVCSYGLGATHRDARGDIERSALPGSAQARFFAPTHIQTMIDELGANGYYTKMTPLWRSFLDEVDDWISIKEFDAPEGIEAAYRAVLDGNRPDIGFVVVADHG